MPPGLYLGIIPLIAWAGRRPAGLVPVDPVSDLPTRLVEAVRLFLSIRMVSDPVSVTLVALNSDALDIAGGFELACRVGVAHREDAGAEPVNENPESGQHEWRNQENNLNGARF